MKMHHYVECGLDNVYLLNVDYANTDDARSLSIANVDRLHHAIASAIVLSSRLLRGSELFFLRTELGFKTKEYCAMLGVSKIRLFKWEEGMEPVSAQADLAARLIYAASCSDGDLGREVIRLRLDETVQSRTADNKLFFERGITGWLLMQTSVLPDDSVEA